MRKNKKIILIIEIITICTMVFIEFTIFKIIEHKREIPFYLNESYYSFSANFISGGINGDIEQNKINLKEEILEIIFDHENGILIKQSIYLDRVSIHDPSQYYYNFNVNRNGKYFSKEDFHNKNSNIMVNENSIYYDLIYDSKLYLMGEYKKVIATYSSDYVLNKNNNYIVLPLIDENDFRGNYYLMNYDEQIVNEIISIFENYGYEIKINLTNRVNLKEVFTSIEAKSMIPSLFIVLFSNFTFFCLIFLRNRKTLNVHYIFGARSKSLFRYILKGLIYTLLVANIVGTFIGVLIGFLIYREISFSFILISIFTNIIILITIIKISFTYIKSRVVMEDIK